MTRNTLVVPQVVCILLLLWAIVGDSPYGYYVLVRWVCCPTLALLAWRAYQAEHESMAWALGVSALVYNPVLRVHATRELWQFINAITIILIVVSIRAIRGPRAGSAATEHQ